MLSLDQHLRVHTILEDEAAKARASARKVAKVYDAYPYGEGFDAERNAAAALLSLKNEIASIASRHAQQYFVDYIRDQII